MRPLAARQVSEAPVVFRGPEPLGGGQISTPSGRYYGLIKEKWKIKPSCCTLYIYTVTCVNYFNKTGGKREIENSSVRSNRWSDWREEVSAEYLQNPHTQWSAV